MDTQHAPHAPCHDLESIFYVLIYAITIFKGPDRTRKIEDYDALSSIPVLEWFEMEYSFRHMARLRIGHLCDFNNAILNKMDGYFQPLFPFLRKLVHAFFPDHHSTANDYNNKMNAQMMIDLFNEEYNKLKASESKQSVQMTERGKRGSAI
jgi:hypothetical protein